MLNPCPPLVAKFHPMLFAVSAIALVWCTVLLYAGGFTTTIGAGMAFLDWPLSNGSINPEGWTRDRDQFAEHSHRLAGMVIGLLSILIVALFWRFESRRWLCWLAVVLLLTVILQGVLGGMRVLWDELNTGADHNKVAQTFAVMHALGAQSVVLLLTVLLVCSCPGWFKSAPGIDADDYCHTRRLAWILLALTTLTILLGAIMRHIGAGLAIPTFPAATPDGNWLPASFTFATGIHFAHRTLGILLLPLIVYCGWKFFCASGNRRALQLLGLLLPLLAILQIALGWLILQTLRNDHVTTLHMLNGAALMATTCACLCWSYRYSRTPSTASATGVDLTSSQHNSGTT